MQKKTPIRASFLFTGMLSQLLLQIFIDGVQEIFSVQVVFPCSHLVSVYAHRKILRHLSTLDGFDAHCFECIRKVDQLLVVVELTAEGETTCPREDGSDWIR
jgi:hypothetical protein